MSVRVNLLRPEEIRCQVVGAKKTFLAVAGIVAGALLVVGLAWSIVNVNNVLHGRAKVKQQRALLQGTYEEAKLVKQQHLKNQHYLNELKGWNNSRIEWSGAMDDIQELIPANIQINRLSVVGDIRISEAEPATDEEQGTLARQFHIRLEGTAEGAFSDKDVIVFVDKLRVADGVQPWLASMKLQGLQVVQREIGDEKKTEQRSFQADAISVERLMK